MIQQLTESNGSNSRWAQLAVAGAAGSLLSTFFFTFLAQPERMFELAEKWGPWVTLVFAGLLIFDRRMGQGVKLLRESAVVTARLTDSVAVFAQAQQTQAVSMRDISEAMSRVAQRDDQRVREQDIMLNHLAKQTHSIMEKLEEMDSRLPR